MASAPPRASCFGGILTDLLSWEWIFFVNIPVGIVALILTPLWVMESRDLRTKTFDVLGRRADHRHP